MTLAVIRALGVALVAVLGGACSSASPSAAGAPVSIENDTDVPVGLYVDGDWVGTYAAGASVQATLPAGAATGVTVELRSPSDAVLVSLPVSASGLEDAIAGGYATGESVGLPCGVLTVVIGRLEDGDALPPAASVAPGRCQ